MLRNRTLHEASRIVVMGGHGAEILHSVHFQDDTVALEAYESLLSFEPSQGAEEVGAGEDVAGGHVGAGRSGPCPCGTMG
jgi:hypothetical protein